MEIEENFPRGRIPSTQQTFANKVTPFPKASNKNDKKRKRTTSLDENIFSNPDTELFSTAAEGINYKKVQDQMLLLACVRDISPLSLDVELPGKMAGKIRINSISNKFLSILREEHNREDDTEEKNMTRLSTMFQVGQFVPTKVMEKVESSDKTNLLLSANPIHINSDWNHSMFKKGILLWAAVDSKLEHGYVLDAGISKTRIFLPFENIDEGTTLVVGQPLWCVVQECTVSASDAIIKTSILKSTLESAIHRNMSLHFLVPGMQFNFTITKLVKYGLQGQFMDDCSGYINEAYLARPLDKLSRYRTEQTLKAWLLYVEPTTKFGYFTLKNINCISNPEYEKGKILRAQVVSKTAGGLTIKLPNNAKGFMSNRRLFNMLPNKKDFSDAVSKKFRPDSYRQCRVLDYNCMEDVYIATFEPSVLTEKYFTLNDVKVGELVTVKVLKVTKEGIQVTFGKLKGFIQNLHLSNSKYSENIKKRFSMGKSLPARVLNISENGIYLTHKKELLNSDLCLSSYNDILINQQYPGVVVNKSPRGVLVVFYNNVRGLLFRKYLQQLYPDYTDNMYFEGQVIMTTVTRVVNDTLHLNLKVPKQLTLKSVQIGQFVDAIITEISKSGLTVDVPSHNVSAFVPTAHLSSSLQYTLLLLETYKIGDTLTDLLCVDTKRKPILSLREGAAYKSQNMTVQSIKDVQVGSLIRGSFGSCDLSGICVSVPFVSKNIKLKIPYEQILDAGCNKKSLNLHPQQAIVMKVQKLDEHHKIHVTAKLPEVFDGDYKYSVELLKQCLQDLQQIQTLHKKKGSPLTDFQLGKRVECKVCTVTENGCKVLLKNDVQGFVSTKHYAKNMKPGQILKGVVLYVNYPNEYVEISLNPSIIEKVNEVQDGAISKDIGTSSSAILLLDHPDYMVAVLCGENKNRQLIFLPTRFHENAFLARLQIEELSKIKVIIEDKVGSMLVGMEKQTINALKKRKAIKRKKNLSLSANKKRRLNSEVAGSSSENENTEADDVSNNEQDCEEEMSESEQNVDDDAMQNESEEEMSDSEQSVDDDAMQNESEEEMSDSEQSVDDDAMQHESEEEPADSADNSVVEDEQESDVDLDTTKENEVDKDSSDNNDSGDDFEEEISDVANSNELTDSSDDNEGSDSSEEDHNDVVNSNKLTESSDNNDSGNSSAEEIKDVGNSNKTIPALPGMQNFFKEPIVCKNEESSSDEEEEEVKPERKPKKKLTPAERKELARLEEEELIKKETENADLTAKPQSVEQFQRLLKGKPNSSETWIRYITFLISTAEFEKAKSVAVQALETVDMQLTEERFNIWVLRLNLENLYGDKNSFEEVFNEAVKCNDALRIYLAAIKILAKAQKNSEMGEKIQKAKRKFGRESLSLWTTIGRIYYEQGQLKEARNFKDTGVLKLALKNDQISLVVQFAIMEFQHGERNHGEALFETVLQHNPKRVDIWTAYVDQIIKIGDFEAVRRILERAVSQSIPIKKRKILFKKYKDFELQHGDNEQIQHVVDLARKCASGLE